MTTTCVSVKELPESIRNALNQLGYHRVDIEVNISETVCLLGAGSDGQRAFACILNLSTGESKTEWGSWGGSNMFSPRNRVDNDDRSHVLGENIVVIKGSKGNKIYARIYIGKANVIPMLPSGEKLNLISRQILYCYRAFKPAYRVGELKGIGATDNEINKLIVDGYLKKDGRGIQITTKGKAEIAGILNMPS